MLVHKPDYSRLDAILFRMATIIAVASFACLIAGFLQIIPTRLGTYFGVILLFVGTALAFARLVASTRGSL